MSVGRVLVFTKGLDMPSILTKRILAAYPVHVHSQRGGAGVTANGSGIRATASGFLSG